MMCWRSQFTTTPLAIAALATLLSIVGCQTTTTQRDAHDPMAVRDAAGMPRSLALSGDTQREADPDAWYVDRLDYPRTVASGRQTVTVERSYVYIYDRQSNYHGRSHDHYSNTRITRQATYGSR